MLLQQHILAAFPECGTAIYDLGLFLAHRPCSPFDVKDALVIVMREIWCEEVAIILHVHFLKSEDIRVACFEFVEDHVLPLLP